MWWRVMMTPQDLPQNLLNSIANRNAVFLCGAGISRGVEDERGFPGGGELARDMAEKLLERTVQDAELLNLKQITQEVVWADNGSHHRLNRYLREVFADPAIKPLRAHKYLAHLECNVITTNYDTLIEQAFSEAGKRCGTIVQEDDLTRTQEVNVIKIHGCVTHLDTIVITEEDYYRWLISDSEIKTLVRLWFLQRPIVFIGFSLSDPNLRQLYYGLRLRFGKALQVAYAVFKERLDNYDMRFIEEQKIKIIELDATTFLEDLVEQVVLPRAFEEYDPIACAELLRNWRDSHQLTHADLKELVGKSESRISDILTLADLPNRYKQLVKNGTIKQVCATYVQRIREVLEKRGELAARDDEIYEWAQTGPSQPYVMRLHKQLKAGKDWSELG
jgi:antitoxin component HigA of HigAB toxin-antitoxin module